MASGSEMIKWRAYQNRSYLVLHSLPKYSVAAFNFRFRQWTGRAIFRILPFLFTLGHLYLMEDKIAKCVSIYSNIKNYITWPQVQIHGPVSLSENVECIVVNARHQADTRIGSLLDLFVEQNKCNLIWMDPDDLTGVAPTPHSACGHHVSAESLSRSRGRRRSLGHATTRKLRKRWRLSSKLEGRTTLGDKMLGKVMRVTGDPGREGGGGYSVVIVTGR